MKRFCIYPFTQAQINANGNVYVCCKSWSGVSLGNIFKNDFVDIWNSETAKALRESIYDGSFRFCRSSVCHAIISGLVDRGTIPTKFKDVAANKQWRLDTGPECLSLNYDNSCNLHCKSCRNIVKMMDNEKVQRIIKFQDSLLDSDLFKGVQRVVISGSGEVFASKVYMDFLQKLDDTKHPGLKITLRTNGILLTPENWAKIKNAHYAIDVVSISIDAATKNTYRRLREGGDFNRLMANLELLEQLKRNNKFKIWLNFVVQEQNFEEMPAFLELGRRFDCDKVAFAQLENKGTYSQEEYTRLAVHQPDHPQFQKLKSIIRTPIFKTPMVSFQNLSHLLNDEN